MHDDDRCFDPAFDPSAAFDDQHAFAADIAFDQACDDELGRETKVAIKARVLQDQVYGVAAAYFICRCHRRQSPYLASGRGYAGIVPKAWTLLIP